MAQPGLPDGVWRPPTPPSEAEPSTQALKVGDPRLPSPTQPQGPIWARIRPGPASFGEQDIDALRVKLWTLDPALQNDPDNTDRFVNQFLTAASQDTALFDEFKKDPVLALGHSTKDYAMLRALSHQAEGEDFGDAILRSALERYDQQHGSIWSASQMLNQQDASIMKWTEHATPGVIDELGQRHGEFGDLSRTDINDIEGRGGAWAFDPDTENLAVSVSDGKDSWNMLIRLDPGTEINTTTDAIEAYLLARGHKAHILDDTSDQLPGNQTDIGSLFETLGDSVRWVEDNGGQGVINAISDSIAWGSVAVRETLTGGYADTTNPVLDPEGYQEEQAQAIRDNSDSTTKALSNNELTMALLPGVVGDDAAHDEIILAMGDLNTLIAEDPSVREQYADMTTEEALKRWQTDIDERGILMTGLQEHVLTPALTVAMAYDQLIHQIGIAIANTPDALGELSEGWDKSMASYQEAFENETVADYFNIDRDSNWWMLTNVGASFLFDPITWITPGAKASWAWTRQVLTNPKYVTRYVRSPQFRSSIRHLVDKNDLMPVLSFVDDGMTSPNIRKLINVADTTYDTRSAAKAARAQVGDILEQEMRSGDYIPRGPRRLIHRNTAEGMGNVFGNLPVLSDAQQEGLAQMLVRAQRTRNVRVTKGDYLGDAFNMAVWRYPTDTAGATRMMREAVEVFDETYLSDDLLQATILEQQQTIRTSMQDASQALTPGAAQVRRARQQLTAVDREILQLQKQAARAEDATQFTRQAEQFQQVRGRYERLIAEFGEEFDQYTDFTSRSQRQLTDLSHKAQTAASPKDTTRLTEWYHQQMYDWAREKGVDVLEGVDHPFLKSADGSALPQLDWSQITGDSRRASYSSDELVRAQTGYTDDPLLQRQLHDVGIGAMAGQTSLPVSPLEMVAFSSTPAYRKFINTHYASQSKIMTSTLNAVQSVFSTAVLLNLLTPIKSHLDEIARFFQDVGFSGDVARAALIMRPATRQADELASQFGEVGLAAPRGREVRAGLESPVSQASRAYEMVDPSRRGNWVHSERWVNQQVVNQPPFQAYARAVASSTDEAAQRVAFESWWQEVGAQISPKTKLRTIGNKIVPVEIGADDAFDVVKEGFDQMVARANPKAQAEIRRRVLEAGVLGQQLPGGSGSAKFWRQFGEVPAQSATGAKATRRGPLQFAWDALYGTPSGRRGSVMFDHGYDFAMDVLSTRHGDRILTRERLAKMLMDRELVGDMGQAQLKASEMLQTGTRNQLVRDLVNDGNWRLWSDLEAKAANYGAGYSDDLMYQLGATSVLGKKASRFYPWGRAQFDYLGYWWNKLREPTTLRLPPVGGPGTRARLGVGAQRTFSPNVPGLRNVNLRLADRISQMFAIGGKAEMRGEDAQQDIFDPERAIATFTFLPTKLDDQFIIENSLSPHPTVSWAVNWLPEDHPIRRSFSELHPSHAIFSDYTNAGQNWLTNITDAVIPTSGRSARTGLSSAAALLLSQLGIDPRQQPEQIQTLINMFMIEQEPPYYRDYTALQHGDYFAENVPGGGKWVFTYTPAAGEMADRFGELDHDALMLAYSREGYNYLQRNVGVQTNYGSEAQYVAHYTGMADYLDDWTNQGYISPGAADNFRLLLETIQPGLDGQEGVSVKDRLDFADAASDILFSALPFEDRNDFIVMHPEVATNLVSQFEVVLDRVPDEYRRYVDPAKLRITARGEQAREIRGIGRDEGWLALRDLNEVGLERAETAQRAASNWLKWLWEDDEHGTGLKWSQGTEAQLASSATISADTVDFLRPRFANLGIKIPPHWEKENGTLRMPLGEWKDLLREKRDFLEPPYTSNPSITNKFEKLGTTGHAFNPVDARRYLGDGFDVNDVRDYAGSGLISEMESDVSKLNTKFGWGNPSEWEDVAGLTYSQGSAEAERESYRARFRAAVTLNPEVTEQDYIAAGFDRWFGDLNWTPPTPSITDRAVSGPPDDFHVIDGDTIQVQTEDGVLAFRLLGVNAPEEQQVGYDEATQGLADLIANANEVTVSAWQPEVFGETQAFKTTQDGIIVDRNRVFVWLFVDGVPVYDPAAFTALNPRGVGIGGEVPDYQGMLNTNRTVEGGV